MTKKQIKALQNIIARENARHPVEITGGIHPSMENFCITDGRMIIMFHQKPEGFPDGSRLDDFDKIMKRNLEYGNHIFALTATADLVSEWKKLIKPWNRGMTPKNGAVPVEITAKHDNGSVEFGRYDPRLLVDAVETVGPNALVYIGKDKRFSTHFPTLLIFPKNWVDTGNSDIAALVLPRRD